MLSATRPNEMIILFKKPEFHIYILALSAFIFLIFSYSENKKRNLFQSHLFSKFYTNQKNILNNNQKNSSTKNDLYNVSINSTEKIKSEASEKIIALVQNNSLFKEQITYNKNNKIKYSNYIIKKGDTLSKIAKKFNLSLEDILTNNNFNNPNLIFIGEMVKIPL